MSALDSLLDELAERLAARVVERLRGPAPADMVSQVESPLGRRRHCSAVKRRVARGEAGAAIVGRRHLLSSQALAVELGRISNHHVPSDETGAANSVRTELERELRLVRGGVR